MAADLVSQAQEGVYARKQISSNARLVSWSHRRRFEVATALGAIAAGRRVLDYGCGDGTFLAMLMQSDRAPAEAVGAEIARDLVEGCRSRLGGTGISFLAVDQLAERPGGTFDVIFCMEVLEHVIDDESILETFGRLLTADGTLIVSVPVETGVPLVVKQVVRRIAGWRGIGDYPGTTPYRIREWMPSVFAGSRQHVERPVHVGADGTRFHDHKGFNWMRLRRRLGERFQLVQVLSSPFTWLPPHCGTQAWFVARKRHSTLS